MPYQDGYVPSYYGGHYSNRQSQGSNNQQARLPSSHVNPTGYAQNMQQNQLQPPPPPPPPAQVYQQDAFQHSQTPYGTPQYYGQDPLSFYQAPHQPPFASPPQSNFPQNLRYSPDPLHYYQHPPRPRQTPQHQHHHQQQQRPPQRASFQSSPASQNPNLHLYQVQSANPIQGQHFQPSPYGQTLQSHAGSGNPQASSPPYMQGGQAQTTQPSLLQSQHSQQTQQQQAFSQNFQTSQQSVNEFRRPSTSQLQKSSLMRPQQYTPNLHSEAQPVQNSPHLPPSINMRPSSAQSQGPEHGTPTRPPLEQIKQTPTPMPNPTSRPPSAQHYRGAAPDPSTSQAQHHFTNDEAIGPAPAQPVLTIDPAALQQKPGRPASTVQHSSVKYEPQEEELQTLRSPKRRRSNDGTAIPAINSSSKYPQVAIPQYIKQDSKPLHRPHPPENKHRHPASSPPAAFASSSQIPSTPTPTTSLDYQAVLLSLSDEYISAAYSLSSSLAAVEASTDLLDEYHLLLSTGLGCLDTVLKNYRIPDPRKEVRIRLRYASILYEETENYSEATDCLTKGIAICERARLTDLKYSMHHLLARIWHKGNKIKAAITALDRVIIEVEKLQLLHWVYAFRFLRASFGMLARDGQTDTIATIRNLTALSDAASKHYHPSVHIVASTLEALVHLRSRAPESVDSAQRALAAARTYQLSPEMTALPQADVLLDCIDLACCLVRFNRKLADEKMQAMQTKMDQSTRDSYWHKDGMLLVPVSRATEVDMEAETGGIFKNMANGEVGLAFSWLTMSQAYTLGFLISGLSLMDKSGPNDMRAERLLAEALGCSKKSLDALPQSQTAASKRWSISVSMRTVVRLHIAFACCAKLDWDNANRGIAAYYRDVQELEGEPSRMVSTLVCYLKALCSHGKGDLSDALRLYRSAELSVNLESSSTQDAARVDPIKILAKLNSIEILRLFDRHDEADTLLKQTERYCVVGVNSNGTTYGNKAMEAVYYLLSASASHQSKGGLIITTKQFLHNSVRPAQEVVNNQLLCIVMNLMTDAFFKNIVGEQAERSAKAGRNLATKGRDPLWVAVADRMYAEYLEISGRDQDAVKMKQDAQLNMRKIHPALLDVLQAQEGDTL